MSNKKIINMKFFLLLLVIGSSLFLIYTSIMNNSVASADKETFNQNSHPVLNNIKSKIQSAVDNGKITQAQADKKIAAIENNSKKFKHPRLSLDNIKSKIQSAVDNGKITQAQADKKIAAIENNSIKKWGSK